MAQAPLGFQAHGLLAMLLFALWPFTRLVHVFSAPIGYLAALHRLPSREPRLGARAERRGWEHIGCGFPAMITTIML